MTITQDTVVGVRSGTGTSTLDDARDAGRAAATAALAGLDGRTGALVLVFASVRYDLQRLLAGVREVTGATPLVGATSGGQLTQGAYVDVGTGVSVAVMTAGDYRIGVASVEGMGADMEGAGSALARAARAAASPLPGSHSLLLLLTDGLAGDQQSVVRGVYRVAGAAVPVVGAAAADDNQISSTWVFHDDRVLSDGAVGVWLSCARPFSVGCGHGWTPSSEPLLVTRSVGAQIHELDGRPAGEVYEAMLGDLVRQPLREHFATLAVQHPLGVLQSDGTLAVRSLLNVDDAKTLTTFAPVPEAAVVQVMSGTCEQLLETAGEVTSSTLAGAASPGLLLAFSCVARRYALGDRVADEARRVQQAAGDVPTIGFYTYGEFARVHGVMGYHNATLTTLAL